MNHRSLSLLLLLSLIAHDVAAVSIQTLIDQNKIPQITGPADRKTLNLTGLKIDDLTGLSNIPNIDKVHVLILNRNSLKVIRAGDFSACTELQSVGLRFNLLTKLEPGSFTVPRNLQAVRLGHNKLKTIPDGVFDPKLAYLGLAANPISKAEQAKLQEKLPNTQIFFLPITTTQLIVAAVGTAVAVLVLAAAGSRYANREANKLGKKAETQEGQGPTAPITDALITAVTSGSSREVSQLFYDAQYGTLRGIIKFDVNAVTPSGDSLLVVAIKRGDQGIVNLLLANNAKIDEKVLDAAQGNQKILNILEQRKKNLNDELGYCSAQNVPRLLAAGADPDFIGVLGTPLTHAVQNADAEKIRLLVEGGADINKANGVNHTPLMVAVLTDNSNIVRQLIDAGADVNKADDSGSTPLIHAAERGRIDIVDQLLKANADVDRSNRWGGTALSRTKNDEIKEMLLRAERERQLTEDAKKFQKKGNQSAK